MKITGQQMEMAIMQASEGFTEGDMEFGDFGQVLRHSRRLAENLSDVLEQEGKGPVKFKRSWLVGLLNDRANLKMDEVIGDSLAGAIPVWEMAEAILSDLTELNLIKTNMIEDDRASGETKKQTAGV